jgi:hypothetical protein
MQKITKIIKLYLDNPYNKAKHAYNNCIVVDRQTSVQFASPCLRGTTLLFVTWDLIIQEAV